MKVPARRSSTPRASAGSIASRTSACGPKNEPRDARVAAREPAMWQTIGADAFTCDDTDLARCARPCRNCPLVCSCLCRRARALRAPPHAARDRIGRDVHGGSPAPRTPARGEHVRERRARVRLRCERDREHEQGAGSSRRGRHFLIAWMMERIAERRAVGRALSLLGSTAVMDGTPSAST